MTAREHPGPQPRPMPGSRGEPSEQTHPESEAPPSASGAASLHGAQVAPPGSPPAIGDGRSLLDHLLPPGCTCRMTSSTTVAVDRACPVHGGYALYGTTGPVMPAVHGATGVTGVTGATTLYASPPPLIEVGLDRTLELAHLLAIIEDAARLLTESGADVDGAILRAHGAQLAAGREWPGSPIRSTVDVDVDATAAARVWYEFPPEDDDGA